MLSTAYLLHFPHQISRTLLPIMHVFRSSRNQKLWPAILKLDTSNPGHESCDFHVSRRTASYFSLLNFARVLCWTGWWLVLLSQGIDAQQRVRAQEQVAQLEGKRSEREKQERERELATKCVIYALGSMPPHGAHEAFIVVKLL